MRKKKHCTFLNLCTFTFSEFLFAAAKLQQKVTRSNKENETQTIKRKSATRKNVSVYKIKNCTQIISINFISMYDDSDKTGNIVLKKIDGDRFHPTFHCQTCAGCHSQSLLKC